MIGFKSGEVVFLDLALCELSSYQIKAHQTPVLDIQCHPSKMHRLLITYESTSVVVYSINKDRILATLVRSESNPLSAAWIDDSQVAIAFNDGWIQIYNETLSKSNVKPLSIADVGIRFVRLQLVNRYDRRVLIAHYTFSQNKESLSSNIMIFTGEKFAKVYDMRNFLNEANDSLYAGSIGLFFLQQKYQTLNNLEFTSTQEISGLTTQE